MAGKNKWFLKSVRMDSYGGFLDHTVGEFKPGMNVVYGPNESGKTTFTSFVGGVLFGWPDARSKKNVYKPANAERSGALMFENSKGETATLSRARNADGLQGDEAFVEDLDAETYESMFSLNSDELLQLNGAADMTARLLTAGSGTVVSPSKALEDLDGKIASYTSRSASAPHSITNLMAKRDELSASLVDYKCDLEACQAEDKELRALRPKAEEISQELSDINRAMDKLSSATAILSGNAEKRESLAGQKESLNMRAEEAASQRDLLEETFEKSTGVKTVDAAKERSIRATLDDLQAQADHLATIADNAKKDYMNSSSQHQVLMEAADSSEGFGRTPARRAQMLAFAVIFPIAALAAGVFCMMKGAEIVSLYFTFVGVALILFAIALAGGVAMIALRPNKKEHVFQRRLDDAKWVMLQDEKKMQACQEDVDKHQEKISSYLAFNGLAAAEGSIRRAKALLDEVRDTRQQSELFEQCRTNYISQLADVNREAQSLRVRDAELLAELGVDSVAQLDGRVEAARAQRESASKRLQEVQRRIGELEHKLESVRGLRDFDKMKLELEQIDARLSRSKYDYACLLLARRRLADAVEVWEEKSQPAVYATASRLFHKMTDGAWSEIRFTADDEIYVVDDKGVERRANLLSTGTCQQLYLSLRLALLMTATNVGSRIPILADDILVHFDNTRRVKTAEALLELSRTRQIILLTCHEDIAQLLSDLDPEVNVVHLA